MAKKFLEGCEKISDKIYRIRENITIVAKKVPTKESVLIEGKNVNVESKYVFYIWDNNFNANGRNYLYVIDRVIEENRTTVTLMNHPEDDADVQKICGVAKNPRRENGWMCVDWYPADCEDGRRMASVFDLGGPVSVSSSVLGGLDDDGYVLNDNDFFLERYFDFVSDPSNRVIHYQDKIEIKNDDNTLETIAETENYEENKNITISHNIDKVNLRKDNALSVNNRLGEQRMQEELLETSLTMNVKSLVKDADKIEDLYEKKSALTSAHSFAEKLTDKSLANEINEKISKIDEDLKVLSEKGKQTDTLEESVKVLTESKEGLEKEVATLKEENAKLEKQLNTISKMYEERQFEASEFEMEKSHRLSKEVNSLKLKARKQEQTIASLQSKVRISEKRSSTVEANANTKVDADVVARYRERISALTSKNEKLEERNKKLEQRNAILEQRITYAKAKTEGVMNDSLLNEANYNTMVDADVVAQLNDRISRLESKNRRLTSSLEESKKSEKIQKTRFASLRRNLEEEKRNFANRQSVMEESSVPTYGNVAISNSPIVEMDEDDKMEQMLAGKLGQ